MSNNDQQHADQANNAQMIAALQRELGRVTFEKASIAAVAMQLRAAVVSQDVAEREAALEAAAQQGIWPWPWPAPTIDKSLVLELRQLRDQIDAWRSAQAAAITDVLAAATGDEPSFEDEMLKKITDAYAARLEMLPGCGLNEVVEDVAILISMAPMHLLLEARSAAQRGPLPTIPMPGPGKLC